MGTIVELHQDPRVSEVEETTDLALFVRTSNEDLVTWNRQRIVDALVRETMVDLDTAEAISLEVEEFIFSTKISMVTAPLIRELVDSKLIERGLEKARIMHTRLGVPLYDVDQMIVHPNKENANVPHGPEATNLTLAEGIKKEYALLSVFSPKVGDAHMRGDIHLHDLGFIDRPYCSGQSLEYIKKFGLNLPNALSMAKPAKHPEVLLAHMVKFAAALQSNFAGAIGWDAVNLFFAPYLEGLSDREIKQLAQMMIFEFSQQAVARGGRPSLPTSIFIGKSPVILKECRPSARGENTPAKPIRIICPWPKNLSGSFSRFIKKGMGPGVRFFSPNPWFISPKNFSRPRATRIF